MHTGVYRRQHDQLRRLIVSTSNHLVPLDAVACRAGLARLETIVSVHLALEDQALYPRMMTHDNPKIREIAANYRTRMGSLAAEFQTFVRKWSPCGEIESAAFDFAVEYCAISDALIHRMELEDSTLYALVDMMS